MYRKLLSEGLLKGNEKALVMYEKRLENTIQRKYNDNNYHSKTQGVEKMDYTMNNLNREEKKIYQQEQILKLIEEEGGLVKTSQITSLGIDYRRILAFVDEGIIKRVKSGYYSVNDNEYSDEDMIVKMFPDGIITMETALYYYGYLKERPFAWSIAVSKNSSKSRFKMDYPILQPYYSEPQVLELGVSTKIGRASCRERV